MKRNLQIALAFLIAEIAGANCLSGSGEEIPLSELAKRSEPIVIGTLTEVRGYSTNGVDYGFGKITVTETVWSKKSVPTNIVLKWQNPTGLACPRDEYAGAENLKLIWFLSLDKDGNAVGGVSTRVFFIEQKDEVLKLIKNRK